MSDHALVLAAIAATRGRIVASFELDAFGRTVGARLTHNKRSRCTGCSEEGHIRTRCNGKGQEPRPLQREMRSSK